jgi:hypothetical protein
MYRNITWPVVLYGCETWSLTLREQHRLRVFENRVLRRICGPKRDEITVVWENLHNEELHNLYYEDNQMKKRIVLARDVARSRDRRNLYEDLVGKSEGRRML